LTFGAGEETYTGSSRTIVQGTTPTSVASVSGTDIVITTAGEEGGEIGYISGGAKDDAIIATIGTTSPATLTNGTNTSVF
jgi:hypothetical protein